MLWLHHHEPQQRRRSTATASTMTTTTTMTRSRKARRTSGLSRHHLVMTSIVAVMVSLLRPQHHLVVDAQSIMEIIDIRPELGEFAKIIRATNQESLLDSETGQLTVFAPTDIAMLDSNLIQTYLNNIEITPQARWHDHLLGVVRNHIIPNAVMTTTDIFNGVDTEITSLQEDTITISQFRDRIGGNTEIEVPDIKASNGYLHIVDSVILPEFAQATFARVEKQYELGPDWQDPPRVGLEMVVDLVDNTSAIERDDPNIKPATDFLASVGSPQTGATMLACRRRAFNKMGLDYLPQTINDSHDVKFGELMNTSRVNETLDEFIRYSMLTRNYYYDAIDINYVELTMGYNDCSHMWITKSKTGRLCFNDGCVITLPNSPIPRQFMSSNGVGYITDKCILCSGVSLLVNYASEYTYYGIRDMAQFLTSSEWNMRNLSLSIGNGTEITMFAAIDTGWGAVNLQDVTRLSTDKWKPHQWDFLRHSIIQGVWSEQDLIDKWYASGSSKYNMTSLANEPLFFDYDQARRVMTVQGGDIIFKNIKGVDGLVHFTTNVPLPLSMTDTVYDVAAKISNYSTQITLIDTVFLRQDMRRLLPLTAVYAPNESWEGKKIELVDISKTVLESHMFEDLLFCDDLRAMNGKRLPSLNGQLWFMTVNEDNMPCFDTMQTFGGESFKSCITRCDILARNGVVHELETILLFDTPETIAPRGAPRPAARPPTPPTLMDRPTYFGGDQPTRQQPGASGQGGFEEEGAESGATTINRATVISFVATIICSLFLCALWGGE